MVGRQAFGVAIRADSPAAHVDWRADYAALDYSRIEPPPEVTGAMCRYLEEFELRFGAFDFAIDADGTWWFLECNPNAQWLWLENETNIDISGALADLLLEGRP